MATPALRIRPARDRDCEAIAEYSGELGYTASAAETRERLLRIGADGNQAVFVAESENAVVGWIHVFESQRIESRPFAEVGGLVVAEGARARGIGRSLMSSAEEWARSRGLERLRARSNVTRSAAHQFYERLGYRSSKRQSCFEKQLGKPD